ncbi:MAG: single-stranded DNA-binding protein [Planctomycetota bacterium]|nr:single-stranded DNA-binding protein [Planctomycetota bacterium]
MAYLNKAFLIGNLTRDPELRYTPSGTPVTNFSIAINRVRTNANGERREETTFVDVEVFGKNADACHKFLAKGKTLFVEGRLRYRSWEGPDGHKRSRLSVVAERVQFIERAKLDRQGAAQAEGSTATPDASEPLYEEEEEDKGPEEDVPF